MKREDNRRKKQSMLEEGRFLMSLCFCLAGCLSFFQFSVEFLPLFFFAMNKRSSSLDLDGSTSLHLPNILLLPFTLLLLLPLLLLSPRPHLPSVRRVVGRCLPATTTAMVGSAIGDANVRTRTAAAMKKDAEMVEKAKGVPLRDAKRTPTIEKEVVVDQDRARGIAVVATTTILPRKGLRRRGLAETTTSRDRAKDTLKDRKEDRNRHRLKGARETRPEEASTARLQDSNRFFMETCNLKAHYK